MLSMSFYEIDRTSGLSRVDQLLEKDPDGAMQSERVSEFAPGAVDDGEVLARSLEYPSKFDPSGGLNDSFFEDAFKHGASAQRLLGGWDLNASQVHNRFEARAELKRKGDANRKPSPDNLYMGAFHMTAGDLRAFRLDGEMRQRIRVYDAGQSSEDKLHAEIIADARHLERRLKHELRVRLMALAEKQGLYVSPHLSAEGLCRARSCGCALHFHSEPSQ